MLLASTPCLCTLSRTKVSGFGTYQQLYDFDLIARSLAHQILFSLSKWHQCAHDFLLKHTDCY